MTIGIFHYAEIDGVRNATDSAIRGLFSRAVEERREVWTFSSGGIVSADAFLDEMKHTRSQLFVPDHLGEVMGFVWANNFQARSCEMHFCFYRAAKPYLDTLGKACLGHVLNMQDADGYILDLVTGITPAWNKAAVGFIKSLGMVILGEIPNACFRPEKGKSFPGIVSYCTREVLNHG